MVAAAQAHWPQWRGPGAQGHSSAKNIPLHWSESSNIVWKTEIPGRGWSSPVMEGDEIWVTTAIETPAKPEDAERRLKTNTGDQPLTLLEQVELRAVCVNRSTGRLVGNHLLMIEKEPQWVHKQNSFASGTPVIEKGRLYAHFGAFGTACLDIRSGSVLWENRELKVQHENGPGSSAVLHKDLLIFHMDGSDAQFVAALDKNTGKLAWKTSRSGKLNDNPQLKKSYGTPLLVAINGQTQLISPGANWVYSYDPLTGTELWKLSYEVLGFSTSAMPVFADGVLYMTTGFMRPEVLAVKIPNSGEAEVLWRYNKGAPTIPSLLLVGQELYFINDSGGMLTCLDAASGREHYRERLGGHHNAAPGFADGKIWIHNREGVTHVLQPGKTYSLLAKNELNPELKATPAFTDGAIIMRTEKHLYRLGTSRN